MAMTGRSSKRVGRVANKAALVLAAAGALLLCRASTLAFTVAMARPAVQDRPSANNREEGTGKQSRSDDKGKAKSEQQANSTLALQGDMWPADSQEVSAGPDWATCFVEHAEGSSSVLEEWVLRADRDNVEAFRAFQQSSGVDKSMKCQESAAPSEGTMCLECLAHASSMSSEIADGRAAVASVSTQIVGTFTGLEECVKATVDGNGFCKSGKVLVPAV